MKDFSQYNYDDAAKWFGVSIPKDGTRTYPDPLVKRRNPVAIDATEYLKGNHWLDSRGFIGQLPPSTIPYAALIIEDIKAAFVTENVILEVVETHTGGILGREPTWGFLNKEGKLAKGDSSFESDTGETLTPWWNERQALRDLQKLVQLLVCEGRAVRRLFFPRVYKGRTVTAANLPDALKYIYFTHHSCDVAGVFTDPDSQKDIGIYLYKELMEDGSVKNQAAELSYLDDAGNTRCRIVRDKGQPTEFPAYPLGGHLLLYELQRTPLITEQVQSNQKALNLAHTMMMRNVNLAGSRERIVTNAKPPMNVTGVDVHAGKPPTPGKWSVGPGAVMNVQGWPFYSDDGKVIIGYTNPNVTVTDPVSVETFERTIATEKQTIYSQCHQRHVLIVDKADTSGRAREVARREFERSLKESKILVDASGRWQLEATLRLAAYVMGEVSRYANLRADFNCLIDAGEPDPEKQKVVLELRKPGGPKNRPLISDETARNWIGVEDAAAELAKIDQEDTEDTAELPPSKNPAELPVNGGVVSNAAN